jgi:hypothetical protein
MIKKDYNTKEITKGDLVRTIVKRAGLRAGHIGEVIGFTGDDVIIRMIGLDAYGVQRDILHDGSGMTHNARDSYLLRDIQIVVLSKDLYIGKHVTVQDSSYNGSLPEGYVWHVRDNDVFVAALNHANIKSMHSGSFEFINDNVVKGYWIGKGAITVINKEEKEEKEEKEIKESAEVLRVPKPIIINIY